MKFRRSNIQISGILEMREGNGICYEISIPQVKSGNCGVYEIVNKFNGKRYIGMSDNLHRRMLRHFNDLKNYKHHASPEMQEDAENIMSGEYLDFKDVLEFRVIIFCRKSELTFYENLLINHLKPEYNVKKQKTEPVIYPGIGIIGVTKE